MAIFNKETIIVSDDGFAKGIEESGLQIALDILQKGIYAFPEKSTVRELTSNAYDAIVEREMAKKLLKGEAKVEDYFDTSKFDSDDPTYVDSKWDPSYYDLNWLSNDPNVYIYYKEGNFRDTIVFKDNGVGLGKDRLRGYWFLNYSSKRANKSVLGKYGLGSKVAFALHVDSFRVVSRYNGKKFMFDVYLNTVKSVVPRFNLDGTENKVYTLIPPKYEVNENGEKVLVKPGYSVYYEETNEKNGVEISIEVKKFMKKKFFEEIESQLMYLPNVKVFHQELGSSSFEPVPIIPNIVYRDEDVIITDSNTYNKPHILLGAGDALINYGFVLFSELELEPKTGPIGFIMDANEVEITPNRESLVFSTKTRKALLNKYDRIVAKGLRLIRQYLDEEKNPFDKILALYRLREVKDTSHSDIDDDKLRTIIFLNHVVSINVEDIDIKVNDYVTWRFDTNLKKLFQGSYGFRLVTGIKSTQSSSTSNSDTNKDDSIEVAEGLARKQIKSIEAFSYPIYFTHAGKANHIRDLYLLTKHPKGFVLMQAIGYNSSYSIQHIASSKYIKDYDAIEIPEGIRDILSMKAAGISISEDSNTSGGNDRSAYRRANKIYTYHLRTYETNFSLREVRYHELATKLPDWTIYAPYSDREELEVLWRLTTKIPNLLPKMPSPRYILLPKSSYSVISQLPNVESYTKYLFSKVTKDKLVLKPDIVAALAVVELDQHNPFARINTRDYIKYGAYSKEMMLEEIERQTDRDDILHRVYIHYLNEYGLTDIVRSNLNAFRIFHKGDFHSYKNTLIGIFITYINRLYDLTYNSTQDTLKEAQNYLINAVNLYLPNELSHMDYIKEVEFPNLKEVLTLRYLIVGFFKTLSEVRDQFKSYNDYHHAFRFLMQELLKGNYDPTLS